MALSCHCVDKDQISKKQGCIHTCPFIASIPSPMHVVGHDVKPFISLNHWVSLTYIWNIPINMRLESCQIEVFEVPIRGWKCNSKTFSASSL